MKTIKKNDVAAIVAQLKKTSLQPNDHVSNLYSKLVKLALHPADGARELMKLSKVQLREVHELCAHGEMLLEMYWAERIQKSNMPVAELLRFPYIDNYLKLSGQELAIIVKHLPKKRERKLAYIGSGPLPLTAICYERNRLFTEVVCIDVDESALAASKKTCQKLNSNMTFQHANAMRVDYSGYAVIFVAALVGMTNTEKQSILLKIQETALPGTLVAVRSTYGSRELLYPKLENIPAGFIEVDSYIPDDDVVNSMHLLKIEGGKNE